MDKEIGRRIKLLRKSRGFSQIELAEKIGISFQQIQKYEKGTTRISVVRLQEIADVLAINISAFFEKKRDDLKLADRAFEYSPEGEPAVFRPLTKQEETLLRLFRKVENKKIREGIIKQLRGAAELLNRG